MQGTIDCTLEGTPHQIAGSALIALHEWRNDRSVGPTHAMRQVRNLLKINEPEDPEIYRLVASAAQDWADDCRLSLPWDVALKQVVIDLENLIDHGVDLDWKAVRELQPLLLGVIAHAQLDKSLQI